MNETTPEEIELARKLRLAERLGSRLAKAEEDLADLQLELERFEGRYKMEVGRLLAELDEIEAAIAEEEYKLVPDDEEIKKRAEELRRRAEESAVEAASAESDLPPEPTPEARRAYHSLARIIHPDLALDPVEKEKRHVLMSRLNDAYAKGDQAELDKMADDLRFSPHVVKGDSVGDDLVRAIRQIAQIRARLDEISKNRVEIEGSESYRLREKVQDEAVEGRDPIAQMASRTQTFIAKSSRRLAHLRSVNEAAEDYVKERYGMDIGEFRGKKAGDGDVHKA